MFGTEKVSPELLLGLGSGLLSGRTWNEQVANAGTGALTAVNANKEKQARDLQLRSAAEYLQGKDPHLAALVQNGTYTPKEAIERYYSTQAEKAKASQPDYQMMNVDGKIVRFDKNAGTFDQLADYSQPKKPNIISAGDGMFYDVDTGKYITPPDDVVSSQNKAKRGLNPVWGIDAAGKTVLGTLGNDGSFEQVDLPEGFKPTPGTSTIDLGTSIGVRDNKTGAIINTLPKDIAGVETQKVLGKNAADIQAVLPSARLTARQISEQIASLKADGGLSSAVGPMDSRLPTIFPSTARAESKIEQLRGGAFLQARELLRGGGQITDYEGQKAEAAIARLSTAQSEEDFKAALDDFNSAVQEGLAKLEAVAAGKPIPNITNDGVNTTSSGVKWKVPGQ